MKEAVLYFWKICFHARSVQDMCRSAQPSWVLHTSWWRSSWYLAAGASKAADLLAIVSWYACQVAR